MFSLLFGGMTENQRGVRERAVGMRGGGTGRDPGKQLDPGALGLRVSLHPAWLLSADPGRGPGAHYAP